MLHTLGSHTMEMSYGSAPNSGFFVFVRHNPKRDQDPRACQLESNSVVDCVQGFETCADCLGFGDLYSILNWSHGVNVFDVFA